MKQLRVLLPFFALMVLLASPNDARAGSIRTVLDGQEVLFDVLPRIESGRTMVPVRGILTPLGATFAWDEVSRTVTALLGEAEITLTIDNYTATVNGEVIALDAPARVENGRTMVPLRFFAESLGFRVNWDEESRTIALASRGGSIAIARDGASAQRSVGVQMVAVAQRLVGSAYAWGGTGPNSFDCSGFILYVTSQFGLEMPRTSYDMFSVGRPVARDELQPGDLVYFTTYSEGASHVGIYTGDGAFIHAASENVGVTVTPLDNVWWSPRYLGARRITR